MYYYGTTYMTYEIPNELTETAVPAQRIHLHCYFNGAWFS